MEEIIKQLIQHKKELINKINGNSANIDMTKKIYEPYIKKIDEHLDLLLKKQ